MKYDNGETVPEHRMVKIAAALQHMLRLTDEERSMVARQFCRWCWRRLMDGEICHCNNDE